MIPESLQHLEHLRCVPVIASFSSNGEIKPLYVSIDGIQMKIEYFSIEKSNITWIHFLCVVIDQNIEKRIRLLYKLHEHAWFYEQSFHS